MTALKGEVGKIMFHNAGGTEADVGQTRSWSLSINKDVIETTKQGDTFKTNIGGLISGEGSADLYMLRVRQVQVTQHLLMMF